ncbi:MAG: PEP-CTERM sorting domain-containing protein [Rhodobacteraceae bacterium]|nr:PEP-CTERM sorting domain-containing protein [Paracoccaceae bacterium]
MSRSNLIAGLIFPLVLASTTAAFAAPIVIEDNVAVAAVKTATNFTPYSYTNEPSFEGYYDTVTTGEPNAIGKTYRWGDVVGNANEYDVDTMTIDRDNDAGTISFTLKTRFDGTGLAGTKRSDWFIDTNTPLVPDGFNYAIVLGAGTTRGSLAAGFYEVTSAKTSMQVWSGTGGYGVGGLLQFCSDNPSDPGTCDQSASPGFGIAPPTLVESGNKIGDIALTTVLSGGWYYVTATVSGVNLNLFNQFDILAHSADCSNDALWGTVVTESVPAPAGLALIGLGLLGMGLLRRRAPA